MRIFSGSLKGKEIRTIKGSRTRPITGKLRETFFNIFKNSITGTTILDLYAGTGVVGFEAISMGAGRCIFVETSGAAVKLLHENSKALGIYDQVSILKRDVNRVLKSGIPDTEIDIIFADPPYIDYRYDELVTRINSGSLEINPGARIVLKMNKSAIPQLGNIPSLKRFGSGDVNLIVFNTGDIYER